ncbi:MAG: hypothetical protein UT39_C0008G0026 [Candidatus Woesebacteria bacterium GW2011_GWA1_39_21]|uniref:Uncharacterized protein n=1 Tax=Candidatus Woesebacteria bacterium GW2011_GWA1_39_21 TaxID=1618550 RepID=A0A0G0N7G4_9BACT|nr:MAG: hypothetical protein UT39_C0008G0026 [Candidatus Woesebacteria bacterium GW2011_GWA1_39_21]
MAEFENRIASFDLKGLKTALNDSPFGAYFFQEGMNLARVGRIDVGGKVVLTDGMKVDVVHDVSFQPGEKVFLYQNAATKEEVVEEVPAKYKVSPYNRQGFWRAVANTPIGALLHQKDKSFPRLGRYEFGGRVTLKNGSVVTTDEKRFRPGEKVFVYQQGDFGDEDTIE